MAYLYAVQMVIPEYPSPIKIGFSANPKSRLRSLTVSPFHLRLIGTWPADDQKDEAAIHARFALYRLKGEWFYPAESVVKFINAQIDLSGVREQCPVVTNNYLGMENYQRWRLAKVAALNSCDQFLNPRQIAATSSERLAPFRTFAEN